MIDSQHEHLLTFSAAARESPNRQSARGVNVSTVWRWSLRGVRGVKLESLLCGGVRHTSREALQRFFEATTVAASGGQQVTTTTRQHQRAVEEADRYLAEEGIGPLNDDSRRPGKRCGSLERDKINREAATVGALEHQNQFHG